MEIFVKKEHVTKISALFESAEAFAVLLRTNWWSINLFIFWINWRIIVDLITCFFGIVTITFFKSEKNDQINKLSFSNVYLDLKEAYLWLKNQKGLLTLVSIS